MTEKAIILISLFVCIAVILIVAIITDCILNIKRAKYGQTKIYYNKPFIREEEAGNEQK